MASVGWCQFGRRLNLFARKIYTLAGRPLLWPPDGGAQKQGRPAIDFCSARPGPASPAGAAAITLAGPPDALGAPARSRKRPSLNSPAERERATFGRHTQWEALVGGRPFKLAAPIETSLVR